MYEEFIEKNEGPVAISKFLSLFSENDKGCLILADVVSRTYCNYFQSTYIFPFNAHDVLSCSTISSETSRKAITHTKTGTSP